MSFFDPPRRSTFGRRNYRRSRNGMSTGALIFLVCVAVAIIGVIGSCGVYVHEYTNPDTVVLHVTGKESVNTSNGHEYRVYANETTFVISDEILWGRFNSADVYGKLRVPTGDERAIPYRCEVAGWRVPLFSMFENIKSCDPIPED